MAWEGATKEDSCSNSLLGLFRRPYGPPPFSFLIPTTHLGFVLICWLDYGVTLSNTGRHGNLVYGSRRVGNLYRTYPGFR